MPPISRRRRDLALLLLAAAVAGLLLARPGSTRASHVPETTPRTAGDTATIEVLFLGSYHFNPETAQNVVEPEGRNIMAPERQAQVLALVDSLMRFEPTKVAVEWPYAARDTFHRRYRAYRAGERELAPNEREQVGMRIAARLGHERVHPVDFHFETGYSEGLQNAVEEHKPELLEWRREFLGGMKATMDSLQDHATVLEALRWYNDPATVDRLLAPYLKMTEVAADSTYPGAEAAGQYYERNLRIFANITRFAEPGDRILVVFGAGHGPFLRRFIEAHPKMELVDPLAYLGGRSGG